MRTHCVCVYCALRQEIILQQQHHIDTKMPIVHEINPLLLSATTGELLQIFHHLQEQRVGTYARFSKYVLL